MSSAQQTRYRHLRARQSPRVSATLDLQDQTEERVRSAWVVRTSLALETQPVRAVRHSLVRPQAARPSPHVFATRGRPVLPVVRVCSSVLLIITCSIRFVHYAQQTPARPQPAQPSPPAFATPGRAVLMVARVRSAWVARTSQALETRTVWAVRHSLVRPQAARPSPHVFATRGRPVPLAARVFSSVLLVRTVLLY